MKLLSMVHLVESFVSLIKEALVLILSRFHSRNVKKREVRSNRRKKDGFYNYSYNFRNVSDNKIVSHAGSIWHHYQIG